MVAFRLQDEYSVQCVFEPHQRRHRALGRLRRREAARASSASKAYDNLALDHAGELVYLAPTRVNLELTMERWPGVRFRETREHLASAA